MAHPIVRNVAASHSGQHAAAAAFEHQVAIWNLESGQHVATFDTVMDAGGTRLAVNELGTLCAAAAYHRRGLACYDAHNGGVAWVRPDLKQLQQLSVSIDGTRLYCGSDIAACAVLEFGSGATLELWRGVRWVLESRFGFAMMLDQARPVIRHTDTGRDIPLARTTFAFLDAAFSPSALCVTESAGPIRGLDLGTGDEMWRHTPDPESHILRVTYTPSIQAFVGMEYWYNTTGCPRTLVAFDEATGERREIADIGSVIDAAFCLSGTGLFLSTGQLLSTVTGEVIRTLPVESRMGLVDA